MSRLGHVSGVLTGSQFERMCELDVAKIDEVSLVSCSFYAFLFGRTTAWEGWAAIQT